MTKIVALRRKIVIVTKFVVGFTLCSVRFPVKLLRDFHHLEHSLSFLPDLARIML